MVNQFARPSLEKWKAVLEVCTVLLNSSLLLESKNKPKVAR